MVYFVVQETQRPVTHEHLPPHASPHIEIHTRSKRSFDTQTLAIKPPYMVTKSPNLIKSKKNEAWWAVGVSKGSFAPSPSPMISISSTKRPLNPVLKGKKHKFSFWKKTQILILDGYVRFKGDLLNTE
ncbi:hypothetical protein RND81_07G102600 [Saponaria officinalis]|uniref:Uncharacterized protein n=1 Tax=Saponaria officinalis TaxID=3572 RepID=A0AAW1JLU4_SAPOF